MSILLFGCSLDPVDLSDKQCPCAPGFQCDEASHRCVSSGGSDCTPAVVADGFRASWAAANVIRWEWEPMGTRERFVRYEVHVAERPEDLGTDRAIVFGPEENPELGGYVLQRTGGADDVVTHTMTHGHAAATTFAARLVVIDTSLCEFRSEVAAIATSLAPPEEIVLFRDSDPAGTALPPAFLPVDDAGGGGGRHLEHRPDEDPECIMSGEGVCSQNLRWQNMGVDLSDVSEGEFANTAFLEVSIANDGSVSSFFSRAWLSFADCAINYRLEPFTIANTPEYRVMQIPLRVLADGAVTLTRDDLDPTTGGSALCGFNLGGQWARTTAGGDAARVRIDEVRIRY